MAERLSDADWTNLLRRIGAGKCTPFLGAGACAGRIPLAGQVARRMAGDYGYPMPDVDNLARVAQYVAVEIDDVRPKEDVAEVCARAAPPDFDAAGEVHGVLADLPLTTYITTNYDDFMVQALANRNRLPQPELCRWNEFVVEAQPSIFETTAGYEPSVERPLVYHLHGSKDLPQSMVLTEDDYLDFLVRMSRDLSLLPPAVRKALTRTSLLFVGYSLADWNFRVLFRGLMSSIGVGAAMQSVAVQLAPAGADETARMRAQAYLDKYFEKIQRIPVRVYWGDSREFAAELRTRWEAFRDDRRNSAASG